MGQQKNTVDNAVSNTVGMPTVLLTVINENEAYIYECLNYLDGRETTITNIAKAIEKSVNTTRHCFRELRKKGIITDYIYPRNVGGQVCFSAKVKSKNFLLKGTLSIVQEKLKLINFNLLMELNKLEFRLIGEIRNYNLSRCLSGSS